MTKAYQLDVLLKDNNTGNETVAESYQITLPSAFVENVTPKEHGFKAHAHSFVMQLKKNNDPIVKRPFKKREIYVVSYGMNVGSEVNGERPSLVFKNTDFTLGEDLTFIPLTSALQQKQADKFDTLVPKDSSNNLYQASYARVRQLKAQSVKKVGKYIGTITDENVKKAINTAAKEMLDLF